MALDIAYSTIGVHPINTEMHYRYAAMCGFPAIKGDVRITRDGGLVMCHDKGFSRNANGLITGFRKNDNTEIMDMTFAECRTLRHESNPEAGVASFEDLVRVCRDNDCIIYATVRDERIADVMAEIFHIVRGYDMEKKLIVNSFTYSTLEEARKYSDTVPVSQVQHLGQILSKDTVHRVKELSNSIVTMFTFPQADQEKGWSVVNDSMEAIETALSSGVEIHMAQLSDYEQRQRLCNLGFSGFQLLNGLGMYQPGKKDGK